MTEASRRRVLAVNPGGTSTKIAVFDGEETLFTEDLRHDPSEMMRLGGQRAELRFRLEQVREVLARNGVALASLDAVSGRGGPVAPVPGGTFAVDEALLEAIASGRVMVEHPSLLGAPLAHALASEAGCPAFVVDPVCVDELVPEARITGLPEIPRRALSHALSIKAAARAVADLLGERYEDVNLIVAHLGSGFTVALQRGGRQVDSTDASASGPMAPTRTGSLPALDLARLCFAGGYTLPDVERLLVGGGGWMAHLGTDDVREVYRRIDDGDAAARLVLDATLLQLTKEIAAMAAVVDGAVDGVVITGGVARSERFVDELAPRLEWLGGEVFVLPGDDEMQALARGARLAIDGECAVQQMGPYIEKHAIEVEER